MSLYEGKKKAIEFRFGTYTHIGNMAVLPNLWLNDTTHNNTVSKRSTMLKERLNKE